MFKFVYGSSLLWIICLQTHKNTHSQSVAALLSSSQSCRRRTLLFLCVLSSFCISSFSILSGFNFCIFIFLLARSFLRACTIRLKLDLEKIEFSYGFQQQQNCFTFICIFYTCMRFVSSAVTPKHRNTILVQCMGDMWWVCTRTRTHIYVCMSYSNRISYEKWCSFSFCV